MYFLRTTNDSIIETWQARRISLCFSKDLKTYHVANCDNIGNWITFGPDNTVLHIGGSACPVQEHTSCSLEEAITSK